MGSRLVGAGFCDEMTSEQTQMSEAGARGRYGVGAPQADGGPRERPPSKWRRHTWV